jgi:hypothetical protein
MVTATVTGQVEDKQGAVLENASITAANQKTGVEYPTKSNNAGIYTIVGLPIGTYVVKAEAPGMIHVLIDDAAQGAAHERLR